MLKVLVATDGSLPSSDAVRQLEAMLDGVEAELLVLSVMPYEHHRPGDGVGYPSVTAWQDAQDAVELALVDLRAAAFEADRLISLGDPASAIVDAARERKVDMIVLGTHARQGLERWRHGSVAETVARKAPCPVLILKQLVGAASATAGDRGW